MKAHLMFGLGILAAGLGTTAVITTTHAPNASASTGASASVSGKAASPGTATPRPPTDVAITTVTVYGTSTTMVTPTQADVTLGMHNQASTAQKALSANNQAMSQIIKSVEQLGIPQSHITTTGLNINPQYPPNSPTKIVGYQVNDSLMIRTTVSRVGKVIDQAVQAGANQVNGVNFTTSKSVSYDQSYQSAYNNAKSQAQALAKAMGDRVLGVKSVVVQNNNTGPQPLVFNTSGSAAHTAVYAGQRAQTVTLKVVYRLGH